MRTVLALYLLDVLRFETAGAASVMTFFLAACYLAPLLGGFIADRFLGRFGTIAAFALPYLVGHLVLGGIPTRTGLGIALVLLALGSGAIKPNTSTLMGARGREEDRAPRSRVQLLLRRHQHRLGAVVARPPARCARYGYATALTAIPAALMAVGFLLFVAGRRHYPKEPVRRAKTPEERAAARASLRKLAGLFGLIAVFWFVYDQSASTWIFLRQGPREPHALGREQQSPPTRFKVPIQVFILVLTPLFNRLWVWLEARRGAPVPDTTKMRYGFWIVVFAMAGMALVGVAAQTGKVSAWWLLLATFVITLAEDLHERRGPGAGVSSRGPRDEERCHGGVPGDRVHRRHVRRAVLAALRAGVAGDVLSSSSLDRGRRSIGIFARVAAGGGEAEPSGAAGAAVSGQA